MNVFHDKQVKYWGIFLLSFPLLLLLYGISIHMIQGNAIRNLFLSHDRYLVSSLIEQGVSKDIIAKAITSTTSSKDGEDFLTLLGITKHTSIQFLPLISSYQQRMGIIFIVFGCFLCCLLFGGTFFFLWKREQLYSQAKNVINRYIAGDYFCPMPYTKEGTIYQLFAQIDQLSKILQSKQETTNQSKEFLKSTISDISHQLKTPLTALSLYHEIIADEPDNEEIVKEYSDKTALALNRMQQLIQSLLKITRLDVGSIVFEKEYCFVSKLILDAIGELTTRAEREGKNIIIDDSPNVSILCDRQWTSEAIGNIVKNALDHTTFGDEIHISWITTPDMVRLSISDHGTGIPPEDLHHIFKRFYRSEHSLDTQGVGLGLSLTKSIIEGQGGIIYVTSSFDEGTVFTLSFLTKL